MDQLFHKNDCVRGEQLKIRGKSFGFFKAGANFSEAFHLKCSLNYRINLNFLIQTSIKFLVNANFDGLP